MINECPECGMDLTNKNRETHARQHWGVGSKDLNTLPPLARERYEAVIGLSGKKKGGD